MSVHNPFAQRKGAERPEAAAYALAKRMPMLVVEAKQVAQTVAYGIHGRRRAGPGETFWQFRPFEASDAAAAIDWRRSAGADRLFVREREWEAAHTVWIWLDLSPSMLFRSELAPMPKLERALVLALATAELLAEGGERVGAPGLMPPTAQRGAMQKLAAAYARALEAASAGESLPPRAAVNRFSACVFFSDFLEPAEEIAASVQHYAAQAVRGHLAQVLDPAEETLPYRGRVEFQAAEGSLKVLAERAEGVRAQYRKRLAAHREALSAAATRQRWSYVLHHTSRPAGEALLTLYAALAGLDRPGHAADYRLEHAAPQTEGLG